MPWSVYNSNGKLLQSLAIGDDSIVEGKLDVSNAPTNGYLLQAQSGEGGGLTWANVTAPVPKATGGIIESHVLSGTTYVIHTFLSSGTFTPTSSFNIDYLVIAGGGGGGGQGGGGGAGG